MNKEQSAGSKTRPALLAYLCAIAVLFGSLSTVAFGEQPDDILS